MSIKLPKEEVKKREIKRKDGQCRSQAVAPLNHNFSLSEKESDKESDKEQFLS